MEGNLVAEAVCMENVAIFLVAGKSDYSLSLPNTLKANSTVEILAFFEEKTAKRPLSDFFSNPQVLAWVCLTSFDAISNETHEDQVNDNETHVKMKANTEYVENAGCHISLRFHFMRC